ncbi:MAG: pilus assembly protein [Oligoflexia bacterium]|nr:pilus assembly protein [Oligoflexia bacterium]
MKKNASGQSTVEFILTMTLMMGFVLFFLQISLVFAFGNYAHYATFMAARAYLSASEHADEQEQRAINVIALMLKKSVNTPAIDRFPTIAKGEGGNSSATGLQFDLPDYNPARVDSSWGQGVRYTFKSRIFPMPMGMGTAASASQSMITLKAESWLGREAGTDKCVPELQRRDPHGKGIFDNGC